MASTLHTRPVPKSQTAPRILICEDDPLSAYAFALVLSNAGYEVAEPAQSAEEAFAAAFEQLPSLAIVDIGLKGPIDGISVAAELAPLGVPVVILTGDYHRAAEEARALASAILIKPVGPDELLRTVANVLRKRNDANAIPSGALR